MVNCSGPRNLLGITCLIIGLELNAAAPLQQLANPSTSHTVLSFVHTDQSADDFDVSHGDVQQLITCFVCPPNSNLTAQASAPLVYYTFDPIVAQTDATTPVTLTVKTDGSVTSLVADLQAGGSVTATTVTTDIYQLVFTPAEVLFNYATAYNHNFFGYLNIYTGATLWGRLNLVVNVGDNTVPPVAPIDLAPDVRASTHVVNLWVPGAALGMYDPSITRRLYQFYPDTFDFVNIVYVDAMISNRSHGLVRNDVQGIGLSRRDDSGIYGSDGKLLGITHFPVSNFFDGAEDGYQHEIGHQWINWVITDGSPHWPISELAQGIMGVAIPGSGGVGGEFPFEITSNGDGTYTLHYNPNLRWQVGFTDLDLYLMGMLPASQVRPALVFTDQNQVDQLHDGGILQGPTYTIDANTVAATHGSRVPDAATAQKEFNIGSVIVTRDRLLTTEELAFFDYMAARASFTQPVLYSSGLIRGTARPFYLTTRNLGNFKSTMIPFSVHVFLPLVQR